VSGDVGQEQKRSNARTASPATGSPTSVKALLGSVGPGGLVVRRLLPAAVGALVVLGFLRWNGQQLGLYGTQVGIVLLMLAAVGVIAGLLFYFAFRLDRDEAARRDIEEQLRRTSRTSTFPVTWSAPRALTECSRR